jgi:spermidine synthase
MAAQIVLLRELMVAFLGNELIVGVVLANWLALEALGSLAFSRASERMRDPAAAFVWLCLIIAAALPATVCLARAMRQLLGAGAGQGLGLLHVIPGSLAVLAPVAFPHGGLFAVSCRILCGRSGEPAEAGRSLGSAYVLETLGTMVAGALLTFLLIPHLDPVRISMWMALLSVLPCLLMLLPLRRGLRSRPAASAATGLLLAASALALAAGLAGGLHRYSLQLRWEGGEVVDHRSTVHGSITVTSSGGQRTLHYDGVPTVSTPSPDVVRPEEMVHIPMLFHPRPEEVLLVGGGVEGLAAELLRHPVDRADWVELDDRLVEVARRFLPGTAAAMEDPRVRFIPDDGRHYLAGTDSRYDVILLGISDPQSIQPNRLFTREFLQTASERLAPGGLLGLSASSYQPYMGEGLGRRNASILMTLGEVFEHVRVVPGENMAVYVASDDPAVSLQTADSLAARHSAREPGTLVVTPGYLRYLMSRRRTARFLGSVEGIRAQVNTDRRPVLVFYALSHWTSLFSPALHDGLEWLAGARPRHAAVLAGLIAAVFLAARLARRPAWRAALPLAIGTTGFSAMVFDLAVMLGFQTLYGYLYRDVGLLVSAFMFGSALGGLLMVRLLRRGAGGRWLFAGTELSVAGFALLLPPVIGALGGGAGTGPGGGWLRAVFVALSLAGGSLVGVQFPLASRLHLGGGSAPGATAGTLNAADLIGGWCGGMLGGVVLLPVVGLRGTCLVVALLKLASLSAFLLSRRRPSGC